MTPKLDIESWWPRFHPAPKEPGDGTYISYFYKRCLISVFTYVGSDQQPAFTVIEGYYNNRQYQARLPKHYHPRWHGRLAHQFNHQIGLMDRENLR